MEALEGEERRLLSMLGRGKEEWLCAEWGAGSAIDFDIWGSRLKTDRLLDEGCKVLAVEKGGSNFGG